MSDMNTHSMPAKPCGFEAKKAIDPVASLDLMIVGNLWRHFAFGEALISPIDGYRVTPEGLRQALATYDSIADAMDAAGYTEADAWTYAQHEVPWAVELVAVASSV